MIIPGSTLNLVHAQELLKSYAREALFSRGKSLVGLTLIRRFSRLHCDSCTVEFFDGSKSCYLGCSNFNNYRLELTILDQQERIVHNERSEFILANHKGVHVDCWNLGATSYVNVNPLDEAIYEAVQLCEERFRADEILENDEFNLGEIIDVLQECKRNPEVCGPVGCPGHQDALQFTVSSC